MLRSIIVLLLIVGSLSTNSLGRDWHVDNVIGDDRWDGSSQRGNYDLQGPFRTIGRALQFTLLDFEKVPFAHILSIQYDPGGLVVYVGFTGLCLMLILIYMFSHQRLWMVVEEETA